MSADENASQAGILRVPLEPLWVSAGRRGFWGLLIGLAVALVFVVLDHRKADSVSQVCMQARIIFLQYHAEKGEWPKACDLAAPGGQFGGFNLEPLTTAVAKCQIPGKWVFLPKCDTGGPAVVFTPTEPGRSYERAFGVVDGWLDDGHADTGDLLVREGSASLRLTVE
jgi:hypothetical protein